MPLFPGESKLKTQSVILKLRTWGQHESQREISQQQYLE
ncbi:MAG: hypothetical protein RL020_95 [Pseudomonadota bacterium]|jgi:hypothetical protein